MKNVAASFTRFLRFTERYVKTDMVYLVKSGGSLAFSQIATAGISFLLTLAFANFLSRDAYGTYKYFIAILGILSLATLRGMDSIVTQASARNNDGTLFLALRQKIIWGLLGSLCSLGVAAYYHHFGNNLLALGFTIAAFFVPIMDSVGIYEPYLTGKKAFSRIAFLSITSQAAAAILLFLGILLTHDALIVFIIYCASWTLVRTVSLWLTIRQFPPNTSLEPNALSYGRHVSFINSSAVFISSIDSILIFHYLGAAQLAVYTFAMAPVLHTRSLLNILSTLALPKFAQRTNKEVGALLATRTWKLIGLGVVLTITYGFLAPFFFRLFFPQYLDAIAYSQVFAVTVVIALGNVILGAILNSRVTLIPKWMLYLWNIPGIVLALSAIFFIQIYGIWGGIIAQIFSLLAVSMVGWTIWLKIKTRDFTDSPDSSAVS